MRAPHRCHRYARDVLAGKIPVGPLVKLACERHQRDMAEASQRGFHFSEKAANHAIGFIEKWVRLPDTDDERGDPKQFVLEPFQVFIVGSLFGWLWTDSHHRRFRNGYIEIGKGNGKALAVDTPIATPTGWTTMGELAPGDVVFDERGKPTRVLDAFDVMHDHDCYRITFDDGSMIIADADHLWYTEQRRAGTERGQALRGVRRAERGHWRKGLRTTRQIAETLTYKNGQYQSANHSIPIAAPLQGTDASSLPIRPYALGVWLGDGDSDCARITIDDGERELVEHLASVGAVVGKRQQSLVCPRTPRYRIHQLQSRLRATGLLHDKHIPAPYLRASVEARLELLQGLMDTDGSINKANGQCEFSSTNHRLSEGAHELLTTLGIKATCREYPAVLNGRIVSSVWRVTFYPPADLPVFRLRRKLQFQVERHHRRRLAADRRIVNVEPVPPVPVRCIAVDSQSHLYLAGRGMIPTHNTPLLAAIGLYGLLMDGQKAPEIYAAASDRDQAMIMFRDAVRMVEASPDLNARIRKTGIEHVTNLSYGLGFFRPFSREQGSKSGTRPHMGLIDEVHEAANADIINKIRAGAKRDLDAMFLEITNSGTDRTSICYQHHEHSERVLKGVLQDDRWFCYVCTLDPQDDPLKDESCWIKTNPLMDVVVKREYLRDQVQAAKNITAETNTVLRLNFCIWTHAHTRFLDVEKWLACRGEVKPSELVGAKCFGGLDLGQSDDMSAFVRVWELADGRFYVVPTFWMPEGSLERFPTRPYDEWRRAGALNLTSGEVIDYEFVQAAVLKMCQASGVREVAYDKRFAEQMAQNLTGAGVTMVEIGQGFQLTEGLRKLADIVRDGTLVHDGNPILSWQAANLTVRFGPNKQMRPDKDKAAEKIDGQVALVMALQAIVRQPKQPEPSYQVLVIGGR